MRRSLLHVLTAVSLAAGAVAVGSHFVSGAGDADETVFVPITPCRLVDTRPAANVGPQATPVTAGTTSVFNAHDGSDSDSLCAIPDSATAVATNVTAIAPTALSYLTLYPGDVANPGTANLNFVAGQAPTPNSANVPLAGDGSFNVDNNAGSVHITIDANGYFQPSTSVGQPGPQGPPGADGVDAESPACVIWVADDGTGDFLLLSAALASLPAVPTDPYLIRIAPGVYTETAPTALKTNVDVEGSGQGVTTITCECGGASGDADSATVSAENIDAEVRHVTFDNTGGDSRSVGVYTNGVTAGSFSMLHITATATGGTYSFGVYNSSSSSPTMIEVTATATGGASSFGVYNLSSSSPTMIEVTATATGGTSSNYGVHNTSSSPTMNDVTAIASGVDALSNFGVYSSSSSPTMTDVTATATGATNNYGVYNFSSSSPTMTDVTATATGGTNSNYGVYNSSSSPTVQGSSISSSPYSIRNNSSSAKVADTMLDGTVTGGGFICVGVYTDAYVALDETCSAP